MLAGRLVGVLIHSRYTRIELIFHVVQVVDGVDFGQVFMDDVQLLH